MKLLYIMLFSLLTSLTWSTPTQISQAPQIAQPIQNREINTNILFLFVFPTPADIVEKKWLSIDILENISNNQVMSIHLPPTSNYKTLIQLSNLTNGEYSIQTSFSDKRKKSLSEPSTRTFYLNIQ